jgi:hypothetical protein
LFTNPKQMGFRGTASRVFHKKKAGEQSPRPFGFSHQRLSGNGVAGNSLRNGPGARRTPPTLCGHLSSGAPLAAPSENLRPAGRLDSSGTPEPHCAFALFHQNRHLAPPLGKLQHLFQVLRVIQHVPIIHLIAFLALGLPGLLSKGSTDLAENSHLFGHHVLPAICSGNKPGYRENPPS